MRFWKKDWEIICILGLATILIFWRIANADMVGDDAHYSFRALGMADFLLSNTQTTPLDWYDSLPTWANLSFHDHPLLIFFIHHIFLSISTSAFWLKLPFALFGLGTIWLMYILVKENWGKTPALISALSLVVMADFIALSRRPLMEIGVMFFITLTLFFYFKFLQKPKSWWPLGVMIGLLVEAKFTTVFVFLALVLHLVLSKKLRQDRVIIKNFCRSLGIALVIALPVIIYNASMFFDRGHLSYQFARLTPTTSPWKAGGIATLSGGNFLSSIIQLGHWVSWPLMIAFVLCVAYLIYKKNWSQSALPLLLFFTFLIEDLLIGAHDLYPVSLSLILGITLSDWTTSDSKFLPLKRGALYLLFAFLLFYTLNSNIFAKNFGPVGWLRDSEQPKNYGLSQLDAYLTELIPIAIKENGLDIIDVYPEIKQKSARLSPYYSLERSLYAKDVKINNVILYDNSINWFPRFWIFARRLFYDNQMLLTTKTLPQISKTLGYAPHVSYFIKAKNTYLESDPTEATNAEIIETNLVKAGIKPIKIIYRDDDQEAFYIYKVPKDVIFRFEQ